MGVPVFPVALPGDAVSPGTRTCSFANAPGLTVIEGLVLFVIAECVISDAVIVAAPAVLRVTLKVCEPETRAALAGKLAFPSVEEIPTESFVVMMFQRASTAFTVTLKAVPAV